MKSEQVVKPTHSASLIGGKLLKLYETENFWVSSDKHKFRKHDGTCTDKKSKDVLDLSTLTKLPDKVYLVKDDKRYLVVSMNKNTGRIVLENDKGMQFESKPDKIKGYQIIKEFSE